LHDPFHAPLVFAPRLRNTAASTVSPRWLGLRWESHDRVRLTVRPELINPAGLLAGPVVYAMVDYSMGSALWKERQSGERIATIGISINYLRTAREGDVVCESLLDRRNDRVAVLRSEVRDEAGSLLATAIGSFSIFPAERLGEHDRGPAAPEPIAGED
jgi:uncharacterized protein (TIGR00369 family)